LGRAVPVPAGGQNQERSPRVRKPKPKKPPKAPDICRVCKKGKKLLKDDCCAGCLPTAPPRQRKRLVGRERPWGA